MCICYVKPKPFALDLNDNMHRGSLHLADWGGLRQEGRQGEEAGM